MNRQRRTAASAAAATLTAAMVGVLALGAGAQQQSRTYTTDADFDLGVLLNVNHDAPNNDQLQLDSASTPFPFLSVALSGRDSVARIDVNSGAILGEYLTHPGSLRGNPSRATVDAFGNVWVGNRNEDLAGTSGSVVQVGIVIGGTRVNQSGQADPNGEYLAPPFQFSTCVDRDGDGLIRTANGVGALAWPDNGDGAGGAGGGPALVQDALDECILVFQRTNCPNIRHLSVDGQGDVWAGGYPFGTTPSCFELLDGLDGTILRLENVSTSCGGYAGLVDGAGILWSSSFGQDRLMRLDPAVGAPPACIQTMQDPAGVGLDSGGNVWLAGSTEVRQFDPAGNQVAAFPVTGSQALLGLVVHSADDNVWVASRNTDEVYRLDPAGNVVAAVPVGNEPNGVSVDVNGKVWVCNGLSDDLMRIDPATNAVDMTVALPAGSSPFNPSDMTGSVTFTSTLDTGTWNVVYDSGVDGFRFGSVSYSSQEQNGASLQVAVRAADQQGDLGTQAFLPVSNGAAFQRPGRFLEVRTTFTKSPTTDESPILFDLTLQGQAPPPTGDCVEENRRRPASLLLFPEFDARDGVVSLLTVTSVDCEGEDVDVEYVYIDERDCGEFNRTERFTPCDTLSLIVNFHDPNDERGYVYAFAKDPLTGEPLEYDGLVGQVLVMDGILTFEYAVNAVGFEGHGADGLTDLDGDGVRDLDGLEYGMAPDQILVPRFLGQDEPDGEPGVTTRGTGGDQGGGRGLRSELVLIGLSGGAQFRTTLDFLIYNDNEEVFSSEYSFDCWAKPRLLEISGVFSNDFLKYWTSQDPSEVLGASGIESGWMRIDGAVAQSTSTSIPDPAFYAVLVERIGSFAAADLPFEFCSQDNGDLLPRSLSGDE